MPENDFVTKNKTNNTIQNKEDWKINTKTKAHTTNFKRLQLGGTQTNSGKLKLFWVPVDFPWIYMDFLHVDLHFLVNLTHLGSRNDFFG